MMDLNEDIVMGAFAISTSATYQPLCCKSSMLSMTNDFFFA